MARQEEVQGEIRSTVLALQPYVKNNPDVGWSLDAPENVRSSVPQTALTAIEEHIAETNRGLEDGAFTGGEAGASTGGSAFTGSVRTASPDTSGQVALKAARWSGHHGYIENHWYGWHIHLDKFYTDKLAAGAAGFQAASALIAAVAATGGAAAIIALTIPLIIAEVNVCRDPKGGVDLYVIGVPPNGTVVCNPF